MMEPACMRGDRAGKGQETGSGVPDRDTRTRSDCPEEYLGTVPLRVTVPVLYLMLTPAQGVTRSPGRFVPFYGSKVNVN